MKYEKDENEIMLNINILLKFLQLFIFFFFFKNADCFKLISSIPKKGHKIKKVFALYTNGKANSHFLVINYKKKKNVFKIFWKKRKSLRHFCEKNDEVPDEEIEQLIKDIEMGKLGKESLELFKNIEEKQKLEEEKEKEVTERKKKLNLNFYNVDEVIDQTEEKVKNTVKDIFYNTSENEECETENKNNTKTEIEKEIEEEKTLINKIGKIYDEIDEKEASFLPDEKLDILKIKKKIDSIKNEYSDNPIKNAAKTLLKFKGMLHQPFEKILLNNGKYLFWRESPRYIDCYIPVPLEICNEDVFFYFKPDYIKLEIKEQNKMVLLINHKLFGKINYVDTYWVLTNDFKENERHINLIAPKIETSRFMWEKLIRE